MEMLKNEGKATKVVLHTLINKIRNTKKIPNTSNEAKTVLLFRKVGTKNLKNYSPITLLNVMYKLLTKILTSRLISKLDNYQAREQARFRMASVQIMLIDKWLPTKILMEKANKYQIPLCMAHSWIMKNPSIA